MFIPETDTPEVVMGEVFLRHRGGGPARAFTVTGTRVHHASLLLAFAGVNTRDEADLLRSHTVLVSRDRLPPLGRDEILLADLPGLRVVVVDQENEGREREIGLIDSVGMPAGQILWTIITPDGREILFPAVEEFVLSIEPEKGLARIAPPPGLLDLYM